MPVNINGIGTAFYGEADLAPDHSFITTEWIIFLLIPLVPLRSFRVVRDRAQSTYAVVATVEGYRIVERVPLYKRQVLHTYLFILASFVWWALLMWGMSSTLTVDNPKHWMVMIAILALLGPLPFFVLWHMRRRRAAASTAMTSHGPTTRQCRERELADSPRDKSNVIGG